MNKIYTVRLILRPFRDGDAEAIYQNWASDCRVSKYCRWHSNKNIKETEAFLKMCVDAEYSWAITLKGSDEPIGNIDLVGTNSDGVPEIGYVLSYEYWGMGIMTEAVKAVIDELFLLGFDKIGACHCSDNPASGKVMEKCGMKYVRNCMTQKSLALTSYVKSGAMK